MLAAPCIETLAPYERGERTRAEIAAELGVSERHLRRLHAREREPGRLGSPEVDEAVWLELVDSVRPGARPSGPYYDLATDRTSHDGTGAVVLVADHNGRRLKRNRLGTGDPVKKDPGGPTKHQPDPKGLKGGVQGRPKRRRKTTGGLVLRSGS